MSRYDLTDFEWHVIEPLLPNKPRGVSAGDTPDGCQYFRNSSSLPFSESASGRSAETGLFREHCRVSAVSRAKFSAEQLDMQFDCRLP